MLSTNTYFLNMIKQVKSLADAGLVYNQQNYDAERYEELRNLAIEMMALLADMPVDVLKDFIVAEKEYPTPKVDVRALILNQDQEILMVKEQVDGRWTIPGGWAEIGMTAKESIVKEVEEETGFNFKPQRLLAVLDKRCYDHPPQAHYVYKLIFYGVILDGKIDPNFDIHGVDWFSLNELPELSQDRILEGQLQLLCDLALNDKEVYFD